MGVNITHYVVFGIRVDFDDVKDREDLEKYYDGFDGITLIADGMNGEYAVLGRIVASGVEEDGGIPFTKCHLAEDEKLEVSGKVCSLLMLKKFEMGDFYAFSHYH